MGVLDRLLGRSREEESPERSPSPSAPEFLSAPEPAAVESGPAESAPPAPAAALEDDDSARVPQMRGDFMLLPPMRPTFGRPATFQRSLDEFLTTHRPISVTTEPMAHDIEPERLGMVAARAHRGRRPASRLPSVDLAHRQIPADLEGELEEVVPEVALPPRRQLRASIPSPSGPSRPDLGGQMPSVSHVNQAVRAPSVRFSSQPAPAPQEASTPAAELDAVRAVTRMTTASADPVMRPRGVGNIPGTPISASPMLAGPSPVSVPSGSPSPNPGPGLDGDMDVDLDALTAPSAADIPVISSPPRFRGAPPPQAPAADSAGTRPLLSAPVAPERPTSVSDGTGPAEVAPELAHRSAPSAAAGHDEARSVPPAVPTEAPVDGPAAASPARPADESPARPADVSTPGPAGTMTAPAQPRLSRSLLGGQPSVTTPPPPMFGGAPEVATGSTGIQRKARVDSAATPSSVRPADRPATRPSSAQTMTPTPAGRVVDGVPPRPPAPTVQSSPAPRQSSLPTQEAVPGPSPAMSPPPSDLGGSTGAQRKARAGTMPPAGTPTSVADSPADAPGEGRVDDAADGPTDATTVQSPPPIVVPVPPEVRRAVAEAAGSAPDTALVHMGEHAHGQADALNAEAFTRDGEIFLAADAQLDTPRGQALLAHELTHVVQQQRESIPMPEESTDKGKEHEEAATRVERALAEPPRAADPVALHHAGPTRSAAETVVPLPPSLSQAPRSVGASPALSPQAVNVPQGVQRKAVGSDEEDRIRMPPQPVLEPAHASVLQPTLKEQVDLVHAGKTANGMGPAQDAPPTLSQLPRPASAARPEAGTALAIPSTVSVTPSGPPGSSSGPVGGSSGGGSRESSGSGSDSWEVSRPEPSALEKGIGYFSRMTSAPAAAPQDEDSERGELERQADSLYPFIRSRLRAELVRDLERRGRLSREWR